MIDRYAGCLVGVAVGDALGAPLEEVPGHPASVARPISDLVSGGWLKLKEGQVTDDTEMTLCLARSFVEKKGFDIHDIGKKFLKWYEDAPIGMGGTTKRSLKRLKEGIKWYLASDHEKWDSKGNGTVMRCSPVALLDYSHIGTMVEHTYQQSLMTHRHPDCWDAAIFLNLMLLGLIDGRGKRDAFAFALDRMKGIHLPYDVEGTRAGLVQRLQETPELKELDVTGEVVATVQSAVYCFLKKGTFEETALATVNLGGDADTRGAVVGALAGSYYGEMNIPERWKKKLLDVHGKPLYHELVSLSEGLLALAYPTDNPKLYG